MTNPASQPASTPPKTMIGNMPAFMARPPSLPCSSPTSRHVPLTALAPCDGRLPTLMKEDSGTIETAGAERAVSLAAIFPHQESRELARDPSGRLVDLGRREAVRWSHGEAH